MPGPSYDVGTGLWNLPGGPYPGVLTRYGQLGILVPAAGDVTLFGEAVSFVAAGAVATRLTGRRADGLALSTGLAAYEGTVSTTAYVPRVEDVSDAFWTYEEVPGTVPADSIKVLLFDAEVDPGVSPVQAWPTAEREEVVRQTAEMLGGLVATGVTVAVRDHGTGRAFVASTDGVERTTLLWTPTYALSVYPDILAILRVNVYAARPGSQVFLSDAEARTQALAW